MNHIEPTGWGIAPEAIEAGQSGELFTLASIKQTLVERYGVQEGFSVYQKALGLQDCDNLRLRSLRGLREIASERAIAFHELAPPGEPFSIAPPRVIGEGNHRALDGIARSIFVACLTDARVRGCSAFIEVDGLVLLDYQGEELTRLDDRLEFDPAVFSVANSQEVWMIGPKDEACSIQIDEVFTLLGPHTIAFGHWMWEYLPKYLAASMSGVLPAVPVLIDRDMPKTHRQALELMLPKGVKLIELAPFMTAYVRRLWCAPSQMHMPVLEKMNERFKCDYLGSPPARFAPIVREMARRVEPATSSVNGCEKVFLARKKQSVRKLVNREAIEAVAEARGFRVVCPEDLNFAEQVSLLSHARFVAGPEGSALFLAFFARPGTKLLILEHPWTAGLPLLTGLLSELGIDVTVITGPYVRIDGEYPHFSDYEIDILGFARFLDRKQAFSLHTLLCLPRKVGQKYCLRLGTVFKSAARALGYHC